MRSSAGLPVDGRKASSDQDIFYNVACDAGEPNIQTVRLNREPFVIDTQEIQHGRMKVVDGNRVFGRRIAQFVGSAIGETGFDPTAGDEIRERFDVVIPSIARL